MSSFILEGVSITPPSLPTYDGVRISEIKSSMIPNPTTPSSSLIITIRLGDRGLSPATHLNLEYQYRGSGSMILPDPITAGNLQAVGEGLYRLEIPPRNILRVKVNEGKTTTATLVLSAWRGERLLGKYEVGQVEGLGLEGYKSFPLAKRRVEKWTTGK